MHYFFDTSALQHRYIDGPKSRIVRRAINDSRNASFISAFTILEIASALARHCRKNGLSVADYSRLDQRFWRDVRTERLRVRDPTQRDLLRARQLLRFAGVQKRKNLKSADALIAASCLEFALETKCPVTFCLEDWPLFHIIRDISAYNSVLTFRFIGVDKDPR